MPKKITRVGIIGTGGIANVHAAGVKDHPDAEITALADIKIDVAKAFGKRHGLKAEIYGNHVDLIAGSGVDAVIVCTPNDSHAPISVAAAEAGMHVLCEKPLSTDLATTRAMTKAVKKTRVKDMAGYSKRFFQQIQFVKHLLDNEDLGRVYHFRAFYLQSWLSDPNAPIRWRLVRSQTGTGVLGDLGSHITDLGHFLVGDIVRVTGMLKTFVPRRRNDAGKMQAVDVDDGALFTAEFKNGAMGHFEASRNATGHGDHWRIEVNCEKGSILFDKDEGKVRLLLTEGPGRYAGWSELPVPHSFVRPGNEFHAEVAHFIDAVRSNRKPSPDLVDGLKVDAVLDAVLRSSAQGKAVDVKA